MSKLGREGNCKRVYFEVVSGAARERPALVALREHVRPGDVVVVEAFDRLGRRASELLDLCEEFLVAGIHVESMRDGISTAGGTARVLLPFIAALADAERNLIRERSRIGVEEARRKGKQIGRPRVVSLERARLAATLRADGRSYSEIAAALSVSPSSVKRMLRGLDSLEHGGTQTKMVFGKEGQADG